MKLDDLVEIWREVEKDVIDYQQTRAHLDGFDSTTVVHKTFEHWFSEKPPKWDPKTDARSYLRRIARQILEGKL